MADTYTGKVTGTDNYASSVTISKTSAKVITVNTKDLRDNSTFPVTGITMTSATAFSGLYDPLNNGKGYTFTGTVSGSALTMTIATGGKVFDTFKGNK